MTRQHALKTGRQRDQVWLVDFVVASLVGDALRWYETLDQEVQDDWGLLRGAMLERYSQPMYRDGLRHTAK